MDNNVTYVSLDASNATEVAHKSEITIIIAVTKIETNDKIIIYCSFQCSFTYCFIHYYITIM